LENTIINWYAEAIQQIRIQEESPLEEVKKYSHIVFKNFAHPMRVLKILRRI
jgi:hypothetical protein